MKQNQRLKKLNEELKDLTTLSDLEVERHFIKQQQHKGLFFNDRIFEVRA